MSNDQNDKVSRGRHVAPSDIPSINFDDGKQPGGFIPQQVHGQQNRQVYPQFAQTGHQVRAFRHANPLYGRFPP